MRPLIRPLVLAGLAVALGLVLLWATGGLTAVRVWAEAGAREVQRDLAGAVRGIAAGQPGAVAGLLGIAFAYGFFHAVGPGHGKLLIGGYGLARRVPILRLAGLALAASLAQATVAVLMVYGLVLGLGWARTRVEGLAQDLFLPLSHAAILALALWLVWRGLRGLRAATLAAPAGGLLGGRQVGGARLLGHGATCATDCACGAGHGVTLAQAATVTTWREAVALVAGVAFRPCSGALFLLIVSWQMGIAAAGIAGVYAMGLGTALVSIAVALLAVWSREGALAALPPGLARAVPLLEFTAGLVIAAVAAPLLWQSLGY